MGLGTELQEDWMEGDKPGDHTARLFQWTPQERQQRECFICFLANHTSPSIGDDILRYTVWHVGSQPQCNGGVLGAPRNEDCDERCYTWGWDGMD